MELKCKLNKPLAESERLNFIVEYNHNKGYEIREGESSIEAWGPTEDELKQINTQNVAMQNLTAADVERAIYKAVGMDFDDIIALLESKADLGIDIKALRIELKANNFYRGNPYIETVGGILGFTKDMLDEFFKTNDYTKLLSKGIEEGVEDAGVVL